MLNIFTQYAGNIPSALDIQASFSVSGKLSVIPIVEEHRMLSPGPKDEGVRAPIKPALLMVQ